MRSTSFSYLLFAAMLIALGAIFLWVPTEKEMGIVQRIFYFHVPSALCAFMAYFLVFVGSVQYLRTREDKWDSLALSAAEVGLVFGLIVLISGPLWAKPIWGVYWRWEPRLTSMLITFTLLFPTMVDGFFGWLRPAITNTFDWLFIIAGDIFVLFCLLPQHFALIACVFAAMTAWTFAWRVRLSFHAFG